jgi:asparagine synthase (glutamine-hydrolysing)
MSAIFGLICRDGHPLPGTVLEAMGRALTHWGPDGRCIWQTESAGLGHVHLALAPESHNETMPLYGAETVLVVAARLDNREELCDLLEIAASERTGIPDGRLVSCAFHRWGEDSPRHLFGDWSFAAYNSRLRRLFVARDQLGNTGIFYTNQPSFFAFASSPQPLLTIPEMPRVLNELQLARFLVIFPGEESHTYWEGIYELPPGHSLTFTPGGIQVQRYWNLEEAPAVRLGSDEEYVAGFLDYYRRAVRTRLRSVRPIGIALSSGLDSASVTALAAQELRDKGERLIAFTSVPLYPAEALVPGAQADEWPMAHAVAERFGNMEHVPVRAESLSPIAAIRRGMEIFQSPLHAAANMFWIIALLDDARNRQVGVLLTGQLGNGGISWSGGRDRIFYHFARGQWDVGRKALAAWKARQGCSWLRAIKHHILRPLINPFWTQRPRFARPFDPPWAEYAAIHPAFAQRLGLRNLMRASGHDASFSRPIEPLRERLLAILLNGRGAGPLWHDFGSAFGLEVRDPTADVRLLEYCMGVPDEQHNHAGGERMLIRRAMEGILPADVQWNVRRGKQAADLGFRLLAHRSEAESELERLGSSPAVVERIELPSMRRAWKALVKRQTPRTAAGAASLLLRGIAAGMFLEGYANQHKEERR